MDLSFYQEKFESLSMDYGDGSDPEIVEYVNKVIGKAWTFYALAGVNTTRLAEMMSDDDVWLFYDALLKWDAVIDIHRFIQGKSERFIIKEWKLLIKRGASERELREARSKMREKR